MYLKILLKFQTPDIIQKNKIFNKEFLKIIIISYLNSSIKNVII